MTKFKQALNRMQTAGFKLEFVLEVEEAAKEDSRLIELIVDWDNENDDYTRRLLMKEVDFILDNLNRWS